MESNFLKDLQEVLEAQDRVRRPKEFVFYVNEHMVRYMRALATGDQQELDRLHEETRLKYEPMQAEYEKLFIEMYGFEAFDIVRSLVGKTAYWLTGHKTSSGFKFDLLYYNSHCEEDSDMWDYVTMKFIDGVFLIEESYAEGYGGYKIVEENVSLDKIPEWIARIDNYKSEKDLTAPVIIGQYWPGVF